MKFSCFALPPAWIALVLLALSTPVSAFNVWAVPFQADSSSNRAGQPLILSQGFHVVDFYFEVQGDTSIGWDIDLDFQGDVAFNNQFGFLFEIDGKLLPGGTAIDNGDISFGLGAATDNGFRQLGGSPFVDLSGTHLLFTALIELNSADSSILLTDLSSYTSGLTLSSNPITPATLVATQVPLPSAFVFFASGLLLFSSSRLMRAGFRKS